MASEINSGGVLERRFSLIVSASTKRSTSRWMWVGFLTCAVVVLPLGFVSAQDFKAVAQRLERSVANQEITRQQAAVMMRVLKQESAKQNPSAGRSDRIGAKARRFQGTSHRAPGLQESVREQYALTKANLNRAVAEGRMTRKAADSRLAT